MSDILILTGTALMAVSLVLAQDGQQHADAEVEPLQDQEAEEQRCDEEEPEFL